MTPGLTPEQQHQAEQLAEQILQAARQDVLALAQLLVSRPDDQLLGRTEFDVRDGVHQIGA
jgi:hypothetical protein